MTSLQLEMFRKLRKANAPRKRRSHPEFVIHSSIASYCLHAFIPDRSMWQTTENSNSRGGEEARRHQAKLRVLGVQKGFPDGIIFYDGKIILVEVKAPHGRVQPDQEAMHERLRAMGFAVEVVYSLDEFREVVKKYGVPTREALNG